MRIISILCVVAVMAGGIINIGCYAAHSINEVMVPSIPAMPVPAGHKAVGADLIGDLIQTNGW